MLNTAAAHMFYQICRDGLLENFQMLIRYLVIFLVCARNVTGLFRYLVEQENVQLNMPTCFVSELECALICILTHGGAFFFGVALEGRKTLICLEVLIS